MRTGRLGGYQTTREVGRAPAAQLAQEEFARAAEARERAAERAGPSPSASALRTACRCARQTLPIRAISLLAPNRRLACERSNDARAGFDVMVVSNPSTTTPAREIAEHTLLETGRPVLLSPARPEPDPSSSAMITWFPSLQAWRAVAAAVPLHPARDCRPR